MSLPVQAGNAARIVLLALIALTGCGPGEDPRSGSPQKTTPAEKADTEVPPAKPVFEDAAAEVGLVFTHFAGVSGHHYFPEIMGAGVAMADFDNDGDLDVYAVQGRMMDRAQPLTDAKLPAPVEHWPGGRLFINNLADGVLQFADATDGSGLLAGLKSHGYDMGVAVGDVDGDGDTDLYVTSVGPNRLYLNDGSAHFTDVSAAAAVHDGGWGTSAAFFDYDRDGDLDLFVTNYVAFTVAGNKQCISPGGVTDYCDPLSYAAAADRLYRNDSADGKVRFTDVSKASGIAAVFGSGLGVTSADFNGDGWPDIYVANDKRANQLWVNNTDGTFAEGALMSGAAYNADGVAEASMGVTAGDFDGDGDEDLFMTHLTGQTNTLYQNDGGGNFLDVTDRLGLGASSLQYTGFGSAWFDYDNDGELDLFIANGAVLIEESQAAQPGFPYRQRNQLYRGAGGGRFTDVSRQAGVSMAEEAVGRGAAFGDIDNDGDVDVLVSNNSGPLRLLRNVIGSERAWLKVKLVSDRSVTGARARLHREGAATRWRRVHTDGSYLSASDATLHFGLDAAKGPFDLVVQWPLGEEEVWRGLEPRTTVVLVRGEGEPPASAAHSSAAPVSVTMRGQKSSEQQP